jgi:hypothetical protein
MHVDSVSGIVRDIVVVQFRAGTPVDVKAAVIDRVSGRVVGGYPSPPGSPLEGSYIIRIPDFCYVAPLALIAGILCLNQAVPVRRLSDGPTIAVTLLFAVLSMNRGFVWNVGSFHEVEHLNAPLELSRAHLRVAADEASIFNRLVPLIGQHLGDRGLVAGPDTPDVYFLSGQLSPSGRLFDFFTDQAAMSDDARLAEWRRADVIVFFHGHRFSPPLPESLVSKLRQEFSRGEAIPPFEVRWR